MLRKKQKSGFKVKDLPQPKNALYQKPKSGQQIGFNLNQRENPLRQEPTLQHSLSTESKKRLKLDLLHRTQHPLSGLPYELQKRIEWLRNVTPTMPSGTNYSNMDAPTPMYPKGRPI